MNPGHFRWATDADIPLLLEIEDENNAPVTGATPTVSIQRIKEVDGVNLDGYYWDGAAFVAVVTKLPMTEVDATNSAGVYRYDFQQSLVGLQYQYLMRFENPNPPYGFANETHLITNEVYIPRTNPDPIIIGPQTVMGQLELIKDGGSGLFEGDKDSLHYLRLDFDRVLGLLHHNALVDNQQYDGNGQLIYARIRVFDDSANVPATPGGTETTGLTQEYEVTATWSGIGVTTSYSLKRVL